MRFDARAPGVRPAPSPPAGVWPPPWDPPLLAPGPPLTAVGGRPRPPDPAESLLLAGVALPSLASALAGCQTRTGNKIGLINGWELKGKL